MFYLSATHKLRNALGEVGSSATAAFSRISVFLNNFEEMSSSCIKVTHAIIVPTWHIHTNNKHSCLLSLMIKDF